MIHKRLDVCHQPEKSRQNDPRFQVPGILYLGSRLKVSCFCLAFMINVNGSIYCIQGLLRREGCIISGQELVSYASSKFCNKKRSWSTSTN